MTNPTWRSAPGIVVPFFPAVRDCEVFAFKCANLSEVLSKLRAVKGAKT